MPISSPLKITLYDRITNEEHKTYLSNYMPWRLFKKAVRLSKSLMNLDLNNLTEIVLDSLNSLLVDAFGNQFAVQDLMDGANLIERITVLHAIIAKAKRNQGEPSTTGETIGSEIIPEEDDDWITDLEISLIKTFGWSLWDIDETDSESLLDFVSLFAGTNEQSQVKKIVYCDQVNW